MAPLLVVVGLGLMLHEEDDPDIFPPLKRGRLGSLPGWHQTSPHAEYYALYDAIKEGLP